MTVPLEAPLRHAAGAHWGRFVRTIVEVETDEGIIGLGEMGGGGESAEGAFRAMKTYLVGHNPANLEEMRFKIANPTASLYNNRTQILAALEFACLDILRQKWDVPVYEILGGKLQNEVPFASYLFFRYANAKTGMGEVRTPEQLIQNAKEVNEYAELYKELGGYNYDRDPLRPDWSPVVPNTRWADPKDDRVPQIPYWSR